jgi:hypothetical protein
MIQKFDKYLALKSDYNIVYADMHFNKVLSVEFMQIAYNPEHIDTLSFKNLISNLFNKQNFTLLRDSFLNNNIVMTSIYKRNDYAELINACFTSVDGFKHLYLTDLSYTHSYKLNLGDLYMAYKNVYNGQKSVTLSFKYKFFLFTRIIYHINRLKSLNVEFLNFNFDKKKYIPFNSSYDAETLLTMFFNKHGVDTYHFSHGVSYINFKKEIPIDRVSGENLSAKKVLVWGESSKVDLQQNHTFIANNIYVAGNPKYPLKQIEVKTSFLNCVVFLGRAIYDDVNATLIELVGKVKNKLGINFSVKAHPASDKSKFESILDKYGLKLLPKEDTISTIINSGEYDFAISYNTNAYYEALYNNLVCFRYGVGENDAFDGLEDKFYDSDTLIQLIDKYKRISLNELNRAITNLLVNTLGMGIDRYREILNQ